MRIASVFVLGVLGGCRSGDDPLPGGAEDGGDAGDTSSLDGSSANPCSRFGPFGGLTRVPIVNATGDDWEPSVSADGRALVFSSWRVGSLGGGDVWLAERPDPSAPFAAPRHLAKVSSTYAEETPALSSDGLTLLFSSSRPGGPGSGFSLWYATRPDTQAAFSAPASTAELGLSWSGRSPWLSSDGLRLYFVSWNDTATGSSDIYVASRPTSTSPFSTPIEIAEVSSADVETDVSLTLDELELYVTSNRPGGKGRHDIWVARRPHREAAFLPPVPVSELNSPDDDVRPWISADGTAIYYGFQTRAEGSLDADIWVATRACVM